MGTPPSNYECWESKIFHVHNFLDLPDTKDDANVVKSPKFKCFGHTWRLEVYPGGDDDAADDGCISVYINNLSEESVTLDYQIAVLNADGNESHWKAQGKELFFYEKDNWGEKNIVSRATLVGNQSKYFDNGSLKIKVKLRLSKGCYENRVRQYLPVYNNMDLSGDQETADVAFDLKGEIMVGHKCIIKSNAKDFYVMCEGYNKSTPMPITDVDKEIFDIMLTSLYGGEVFPEEWKKHSEAILKAASKYGFDTLKSEAEVWCAKSVEFTVDNVIGKFMEADGNGYALIKAAAKKFIMEHGKDVVASESFDLLHESKELSREVMAAAFDNNKKRKRA